MPPPVSRAQKLSHQLRMVGVVVLAVGLTSAAVILFTLKAPVESNRPNEALPVLDSKLDSRALEENQGPIVVLFVRMRQALQEPGPLAGLIGGSAVVISLVCFRMSDRVLSAHRNRGDSGG